MKLDLQKYLKILRHLELLPRPMGQDWSELWLQRFSGTVTVWPKSITSDYWNILSDPSAERLARMIKVGERSCWPRIRFIENRWKVERIILEGLRRSGPFNHNGESTNPVQAQQNADVRRGSRKNPFLTEHADSDEDVIVAPPRRQSSIFEELGRQASVLWDDEAVTEAEDEEAETTEDEDALAHNIRNSTVVH